MYHLFFELVLDNADRAVIYKTPDPDLFYARFCDDIIIIHPDERKCQAAFDRYLKALSVEKLPVHEPVPIKEYSRNVYDIKSKHPFPWGKPEGKFDTATPATGRRDIVPWISFLGYQVRYDGVIRIRKSSLEKHLHKQTQIVSRVLRTLKADRSTLSSTDGSKAGGDILFRTQEKLISMAVGNVRLGSNECPQFCWASGFKLLKEKDHIALQLKRLDRNRERQISRLKRRLKDYDLESKATTRRLKPKPPKYYGAPFSYYASCQLAHEGASK
jgi:hypothetical protein